MPPSKKRPAQQFSKKNQPERKRVKFASSFAAVQCKLCSCASLEEENVLLKKKLNIFEENLRNAKERLKKLAEENLKLISELAKCRIVNCKLRADVDKVKKQIDEEKAQAKQKGHLLRGAKARFTREKKQKKTG